MIPQEGGVKSGEISRPVARNEQLPNHGGSRSNVRAKTLDSSSPSSRLAQEAIERHSLVGDIDAAVQNLYLDPANVAQRIFSFELVSIHIS